VKVLYYRLYLISFRTRQFSCSRSMTSAKGGLSHSSQLHDAALHCTFQPDSVPVMDYFVPFLLYIVHDYALAFPYIIQMLAAPCGNPLRAKCHICFANYANEPKSCHRRHYSGGEKHGYESVLAHVGVPDRPAAFSFIYLNNNDDDVDGRTWTSDMGQLVPVKLMTHPVATQNLT
jgi:hypothetical protein